MANEEIGSLKVSLALDDSGFTRPLASVDRNLKSLGGELAILRNKGAEWGKSIDGLKSKQEVLGRTLDTQESKVKKLRDAYEKSVREKGADAAATENLANKLNRAVAEYTRTETELVQVNAALSQQQEELRRSESAWGRLETNLSSASSGLADVGDKMKGLGGGLSVGVTTPLLAIGGAALSVANDFDESQGRIQAQLGLTEKEAERMGDVAQGVWKNAFGENLTEVGDNLAIIKQNIKDLDDGQLQEFAEGAYTIKDAFGAEINETTRTASVLMKTFGIEGNTALDLITTGFQKGGNFSDELIDSLREYAPQFKGMGYNAEEFTAILIAGAESGAFSLDKLADAAKEGFLRIGDGSKSTRDALEELGLNVQQVETDINSGGETAKTAFAAVSAAIAGVKDPAQKTQAAIALLGSPIEDLGPEFQTFFADVNTDLGDFEGSTKKAGDALYDNLGSRATSVFRDFQSDLEPVGETLLEVAEDILPKVAEVVSDVAEAFADMSPEAQENALMIAGVAAAAGPALVVLGTLTTGVGALAKAGGVLAGALGRAGGAGLVGRIGLMGMGGPVGLAVGGIALLGAGLYALNEASKSNLAETQRSIDKRLEEIDSVDTMIGRYETLHGSNKLSNDEMLRYMDILTEMKDAKGEEAIKLLADEQAALLEKSTMTNDEMTEFLGLNEDIVKNNPTTVEAISEQGNAYAGVVDELKQLNQAERERVTQDTYMALSAEMEIQEQNLQKQSELQDIIKLKEDERNEKMKVRSSISDQIMEKDLIIAGIKDDMIGKTGEESALLEMKLRQEENDLLMLGAKLIGRDREIEQIDTTIGKKQASLEETNKELSAFDNLLADYADMVLFEQGIVAEKGKGVEALRREQKEIDNSRQKLKEKFDAQSIGSAEYQEQNGLLDVQQGKIDGATQKLEDMNKVAGRTLYKDLYISEHPAGFASYLNTELGRQINKNVVLKYNSRNGPQDLSLPGYAHGTERPTHLGILRPRGDLGIALSKYASATKPHPGGFAMVGGDL